MKTLFLITIGVLALCEARTMRRTRREIDVLNEMNRVSKNYPKQLWEDFWNSLKDLFDEAPGKLEETFEKPTDVNSTLTKLQTQFETKLDTVVDNLKKADKETKKLTENLRKSTWSDFVRMVKKELEGFVGDIDPEDGQRTMDSLQARVEDFFKKLTGENE